MDGWMDGWMDERMDEGTDGGVRVTDQKEKQDGGERKKIRDEERRCRF